MRSLWIPSRLSAVCSNALSAPRQLGLGLWPLKVPALPAMSVSSRRSLTFVLWLSFDRASELMRRRNFERGWSQVWCHGRWMKGRLWVLLTFHQAQDAGKGFWDDRMISIIWANAKLLS